MNAFACCLNFIFPLYSLLSFDQLLTNWHVYRFFFKKKRWFLWSNDEKNRWTKTSLECFFSFLGLYFHFLFKKSKYKSLWTKNQQTSTFNDLHLKLKMKLMHYGYMWTKMQPISPNGFRFTGVSVWMDWPNGNRHKK